MVFRIDAAAANDGLITEAAPVAPGFRFEFEFWSPPIEETEAAGVSSGTTFPSVNVV